ncbi:MAG: dethiobiotin synthase [Lachnospiraceae bacterium]|nr:dethiobiotin synthase [Lachnospiraceae bacterium]
MSKAIFITGTGTDVGKTFVTGLILKKLNESGKNAAYFKAAMSGNVYSETGELIPGDAVWVKQASGITQPVREMCPYIYEHAYSPHLASRLEGNPVRLDVVKKAFAKVCEAYDYVTVEGSGGILCPLDIEENALTGFHKGRHPLWLEDVIKELGLACLIVADAGLGTINSVVLTVEYMRAKHIEIKGLIFNHFHPGNVLEEDNLRMCAWRTGLKVLACVKDGDHELDIDAEELSALYKMQGEEKR